LIARETIDAVYEAARLEEVIGDKFGKILVAVKAEMSLLF